METLTDYITGKIIPDMGAEANRQMVARLLVEQKGYTRQDIEVDAPIEVVAAGESYRSTVDLVVRIPEDICLMAFKIAAGSLGSREREILAAARLFTEYQIPYAVISDGNTAIMLDTLSGAKIGTGLDIIPSRSEAIERLPALALKPFPQERIERESIIFRSYDSMNVNRVRND